MTTIEYVSDYGAPLRMVTTARTSTVHVREWKDEKRPPRIHSRRLFADEELTIPVLATPASMAIDRGTRSTSELIELSMPDSTSIEVRCERRLREIVSTLPPRLSDVLRLMTAIWLDSWHEGERRPSPAWVDAVTIHRAMGRKKSQGYETVEEIGKSIRILEGLRLIIPSGYGIAPYDVDTRKPRPMRVERRQIHRVLVIETVEELLFPTGRRLEHRWLVRPSAWIEQYPKWFAQVFRELIELPATSGPNVWTKQIGTEFSYYYREDASGGANKCLRVERILTRASLIQDVQRMVRDKHGGRAYRHFEQAMNRLCDMGVIVSWEYDPRDAPLIDRQRRGWVGDWLQARVRFIAPAQYVRQRTRTLPGGHS